MAGDIDNELARDEGLRFDSAFQKLAHAAASASQIAMNPPERAAPRATSYEEYVWLAQQQTPEAILKHTVVLRLTGALDLARLAVAVMDVVRTFPDLNSRYHFSDEGELHKRFAGEREFYCRVVRTESQAEAIEIILGRQCARWNSETQPPFDVVVMADHEETILALIVHRILDEAYSPEALLHAISEVYAGRSLEARATARAAGPGVSLSAQLDAAAMLPDWMSRGSTAARFDVADYSRGSWSPAEPFHVAAARYGSRGNAPNMSALIETAASDREVFAYIAAQFARYLSVLSSTRHVDLFVQAVQATGIGDPAFSFWCGHFLKLTVDGQDSVEHVFRDILIGLDRGAADPVSRRDPCCPPRRATAFLNWLPDPAHIFHIEGVSVERWPLPTLESRPDLALAVGRHAQDGIIIELTTGQRLSPYIGALLLERFLRWTADAQTALPCPAPLPPFGVDGARKLSGGVQMHEDAIAALILTEFRDALSVPELGANDDFFDHGGHSLIATRIIGRLLSKHGIEIQFSDLFSYPSAAALAGKARMTRMVESAALRGEVDHGAASAPLSLAQMSLWKAYSAFGFSEIFNLPFALEFLDQVDEASFARAFMDVVERHCGLRSLFYRDGEEIRQQVVPIGDLPRYEWFWSSQESVGVDRRDEAVHHFDLSKELPFRLRFLIDPVTDRQVLSFLFHHLVLDEWSVNQMMDEIAYCYRSRAAGEVPIWADAPAPFHEFARLQNEAGIDAAHVEYWVDALRGAQKPQGILSRKDRETDAAAFSQQTSAAGGWVEFKLEKATSQGLYALAKENGSSLFNVVYAGITASLRWLGSLSELVVGTSASGRSDPAFFDTIGYFTTVVAHRIRFNDAMSVGELVCRVKNTINESMPHTEIPIDLVEQALGMTPSKDHIFEVFIQIHARNKLNGTFELADGRRIVFRQVDPERHESMVGLHFEVMEETIEGERSIRVLMSYRSEHYGSEEVERITTTTNAVFWLMSRDGASRMRLDELGAALPEN